MHFTTLHIRDQLGCLGTPFFNTKVLIEVSMLKQFYVPCPETVEHIALNILTAPNVDVFGKLLKAQFFDLAFPK